jgi:hypothetical protein
MSRTWIFQSNPKRFDIDGYLATNTGEVPWLVTTNKKSINIGDTAYLWRSGEDAGIIAEAEVVAPVQVGPDDPTAWPFWANSTDGSAPAPRTRVRLRKVANRREVLRRDWLKEDPQLQSLTIIRQPNGTNYSVTPEHAVRLAALWGNIGRDWIYPEVVAAMWGYAQLWNQPISKAEGSLVDQVSRLINRVIPGVYNKLMNLRALDIRVEAQGLSGGSKVDQRVWDEFFDASSQSIRTDLLRQRFEALWPNSEATPDGAVLPEELAVRDALVAEVLRLDKTLRAQPLERLMELYAAQAKTDGPRRRATKTAAYDRNALVVLITKRRASFKCEISGCATPTFFDFGDRPYVETHHLVPLAEGGDDLIANTACLCALHHREAHCGKNRVALTQALQAIRTT